MTAWTESRTSAKVISSSFADALEAIREWAANAKRGQTQEVSSMLLRKKSASSMRLKAFGRHYIFARFIAKMARRLCGRECYGALIGVLIVKNECGDCGDGEPRPGPRRL